MKEKIEISILKKCSCGEEHVEKDVSAWDTALDNSASPTGAKVKGRYDDGMNPDKAKLNAELGKMRGKVTKDGANYVATFLDAMLDMIPPEYEYEISEWTLEEVAEDVKGKLIGGQGSYAVITQDNKTKAKVKRYNGGEIEYIGKSTVKKDTGYYANAFSGGYLEHGIQGFASKEDIISHIQQDTLGVYWVVFAPPAEGKRSGEEIAHIKSDGTLVDNFSPWFKSADEKALDVADNPDALIKGPFDMGEYVPEIKEALIEEYNGIPIYEWAHVEDGANYAIKGNDIGTSDPFIFRSLDDAKKWVDTYTEDMSKSDMKKYVYSLYTPGGDTLVQDDFFDPMSAQEEAVRRTSQDGSTLEIYREHEKLVGIVEAGRVMPVNKTQLPEFKFGPFKKPPVDISKHNRVKVLEKLKKMDYEQKIDQLESQYDGTYGNKLIAEMVDAGVLQDEDFYMDDEGMVDWERLADGEISQFQIDMFIEYLQRKG